MENTLNKVKAKLSACVELFAEGYEVTLPVTFKIVNGKVSAEIGKFSVTNATIVSDVKPVKVEPTEADVCATLMSDIELKWYEKLPEQFVALAVNYNGVCRYVYHTLKNEEGTLKAHWRNRDGAYVIKNPYVASRKSAASAMAYLMLVCNENSTGDRWRDFKTLKLFDDDYNNVARTALLSDTTDSSFKVCVYDMRTQQPMVVCFSDEELDEINSDIKELEDDE